MAWFKNQLANFMKRLYLLIAFLCAHALLQMRERHATRVWRHDCCWRWCDVSARTLATARPLRLISRECVASVEAVTRVASRRVVFFSRTSHRTTSHREAQVVVIEPNCGLLLVLVHLQCRRRLLFALIRQHGTSLPCLLFFKHFPSLWSNCNCSIFNAISVISFLEKDCLQKPRLATAPKIWQFPLLLLVVIDIKRYGCVRNLFKMCFWQNWVDKVKLRHLIALPCAVEPVQDGGRASHVMEGWRRVVT